MSPRRIVVLARFTLLTAVSFIAAIWLLQEITSVYSFSNRLGGARGQKDFWEWETTTRFIPRNTPSRKELKEDDFLCDQFPDDILSQVQVILKVGSSEPVNRLNTQISTVTRCISNLLIVSDQESEIHGHRVHDILAAWPPSFRSRLSGINGRERGWALDRFKFLPMVEKAYEINPTARWFVFLETDTYIVWDNLFRLLDQYDASAPLYMGSPSPGEKTVEGETTWFAHGGTGFVLSRAAVTKLVTRDTGAYNEYLQPSLSMQYQDKSETNCCGDSVLGWALYEKGVKLTGLWPMFNPHALHSVPFDSSHWCRPVISMHGTLLEDMEGLIKWENERNRTVCHVPPLGVTCYVCQLLLIQDIYETRIPCYIPICLSTSALTIGRTGTTLNQEDGKNPKNHRPILHSRPAIWPAMNTRSAYRTLMARWDTVCLQRLCGWEVRS